MSTTLKVKGVEPKRSSSSSNDKERFQVFPKTDKLREMISRFELDKYFEKITDHDAAWFEDKCCYFYTHCPNDGPASINVVDSIVFEDYARDEFDDAASDTDIRYGLLDGYEPDITIAPSGEACVKFYAVETRRHKKEDGSLYLWWIGDYYINRQTLFATDWAHDIPAGSELLNRVMTYLKEKGYLKPLSEKFPTVAKKVEVKVEKPKIVVKVGCDPEFEVVKDGVVVSAGDDCLSGVVGGTGHNEKIGKDGCGQQVEIRPTASDNLDTVIENITDIFKTFQTKLKSKSSKEIELTTSGEKHPLGGHIHIGVGFPVNPSNELLKLFDEMLGKPMLELAGTARKSSGYNKLSGYEQKDYGFEYRTPPACVFYNPIITKICFKIMKNVCEAYFNEEAIEISVPPTKENYMKWALLTEKEYDYFERFKKDYSSMVKKTRNIISQWTDPALKLEEEVAAVPDIDHPKKSPKKAVTRYKVYNEFNDLWNTELKQYIIKNLEKLYSLNKDINILLFGLNESKSGFVSGFDCQGYGRKNIVPKTATDENGDPNSKYDLIYGLPFAYRKNMMEVDEMKKITIALFEDIVDKLTAVE